MKYGLYCDSPLGIIGFLEEDNKLIKVVFGQNLTDDIPLKETLLLSSVKQELKEYFAHQREQFTIPLAIKGSAFNQKVWEALSNIPYGMTLSYQELAIKIGHPKACRAVGKACHDNPIPIIIPCHRVLSKKKKLTGYNGGLNIKEQLLKLEGITYE